MLRVAPVRSITAGTSILLGDPFWRHRRCAPVPALPQETLCPPLLPALATVPALRLPTTADFFGYPLVGSTDCSVAVHDPLSHPVGRTLPASRLLPGIGNPRCFSVSEAPSFHREKTQTFGFVGPFFCGRASSSPTPAFDTPTFYTPSICFWALPLGTHLPSPRLPRWATLLAPEEVDRWVAIQNPTPQFRNSTQLPLILRAAAHAQCWCLAAFPAPCLLWSWTDLKYLSSPQTIPIPLQIMVEDDLGLDGFGAAVSRLLIGLTGGLLAPWLPLTFFGPSCGVWSCFETFPRRLSSQLKPNSTLR